MVASHTPASGQQFEKHYKSQQEPKRIKPEEHDIDILPTATCVKESATGHQLGDVWIEYESHSLSYEEKDILTQGQNLTDKHMNLAQELIKKHYPSIMGLKSTYPHSKIKLLVPRS